MNPYAKRTRVICEDMNGNPVGHAVLEPDAERCNVGDQFAGYAVVSVRSYEFSGGYGDSASQYGSVLIVGLAK